MLHFTWDNFEFALLQFGKGVFTKDMVGHSHSKNSYELHYILDGEGTLTTEIVGNDSAEKWSDIWYIYKPAGYDKTLSQMTDEERANRIRYESVSSMEEFAKWYRKNFDSNKVLG